tara:strand:+ start:7927 stop:10086 length:2160 start_codon:yes stop_codon:yes gene_type:complete
LIYFKLIFLIYIFIFSNINFALSKKSLIYADNLTTDDKNNIIGKGNVKIIHGEEIIVSDEIFIDEENDKILLEKKFTYKDRVGNHYYGSKGEFTKDFNNGIINDFSYVGIDDLRVRGKKSIKIGNIDIVEKAVVTPCRTIKFLKCPFWQVEAEKLVHDKNSMLIYQKHSRLEILELPVFYTPYSVSPSPLRKERRSGFLYPTFTIFNSLSGGSAKLPYYFNISPDKELLVHPVFYYQQNIQNIKYAYNQKTSGGSIQINAATLTNFDKTESFERIENASISLNVKENINKNFTSGFDVNLQTSGKYLREYDTFNPLNNFSSLSSSAYIDGYSLNEDDDLLTVETYNFQAVRENTENKKLPVVAPVIKYNSGNKIIFDKINLQNKFIFYNIFRDVNTADHALRQTRLNYDADMSYQKFWKTSRLRFETTIQSDLYSTYKKQIDGDYVSNEHYRVFPMSGLLIDNPFVGKDGTIINPLVFLAVNGSNNNTSEISNELTTDNEFDLSRFFSVNRYTGNDKYDNGQRIGYGLDLERKNLTFTVAQGYQISSKSDYVEDVNMNDDFSDVLGDMGLSNINDSSVSIGYDFRFDPKRENIYEQSASLSGDTVIGSYSLGYYNADDRATSLSFGQRESASLSFSSKTFLDYSNINFSTSYDLNTDEHQTSTITYRYSDECFGLNVVYNNNFFIDTPDTLMLNMNFKFIGPVPQSFIDQLILVPFNSQ